MPRARSPNRDKAFEIYKLHNGNVENRQIANSLNISEKTISGWKCKDNWADKLNGVLQKDEQSTPKQKGGQPGNKNSVGHKPSVPKGNLNPIKHGAYQNIYLDYLPDDEKEIYEQMEAVINLESEIKLLRLKITRLLNRNITFFYDMFGKKHAKDINEEDRENGILACMEQLEKLVRTQAAIVGDTEKLQLEREKFDFKKYKDEIELQLKREKLDLEKAKADTGEGEEVEDDGFLEALKAKDDELWD